MTKLRIFIDLDGVLADFDMAAALHPDRNNKKKLFLTHRKDLLMGDILIDDNLWNGAKDFPGTHIHFGKNGFDWNKTLDLITQITNLIK